MKKLSYEEILKERKKPDEALSSSKFPITVILDNIRSSYNVGSIFRTCDAANIKELILCGYTPIPPNNEIHKTSLGATDSVPWRYFDTTTKAIDYCKENLIKVFAVELTDAKNSYNNIQGIDFPLALVMGNELSGINDEVLKLCDSAIEIPMYGVKHSLNVAVSTGIVIYNTLNIYNSFSTK